MSFPRARRFDQVFTESVGSDVVMYVERGKTMQYHTLANGAHAIWQAADGRRDDAAIAEMVFGDRSELSMARVEAGLVALMDAGLLESTEGMTTTRRAITKLAAAALLGGIGLPAVVSITAPVSADGLSKPPPVIIPYNEKCYADYRNGVCAEGSCCCHPDYDYTGRCVRPDECGVACVY